MKAILLGIFASFFFAFTFVLNRQMNILGGSWIWSSALRYIFMLPFLLLIVLSKNDLMDVLNHIREKTAAWVLWSTVGFGLFYAPLSFAAAYGPSWMVAGTWQLTIIAGALLSPLFYKTVEDNEGTYKSRNKIPVKALMMSSIILIGIILMQVKQAGEISLTEVLIGIVPVIIAAFAYPLGNRKMIEICEGKFNVYQRVFGMTLSSMPFWIIISIYGMSSVGAPSKGQMLQALIVALCSGVIATILFFRATDIASGDTHKLASVEATQAGEVVFTLLGEVVVLHEKLPSGIALIGIIIVIIGMVLHSIISNNKEIITQE